jgi:tetratricopeptide (TPR) repeat protein
MSNEEVLTRKDMKAPDKFQSVASRAIDWIAGHKKHARLASIIVAGVVVVVIIAGMASRSRDEKAGALAYELLRAVGAEVSAVPLPGQAGPFFATDAEKQKAVLVEADRVIAEYPSTPSGQLALLMKGDAQLRLGDADAAIATYQKYLANSSQEQSLRFGALEGIALAQEAKGKADDAAAAWERAAREAIRFSDRADLERARVLAGAGKAADARKLLDGFETRHKGSTLVAEAAERLARLGAK